MPRSVERAQFEFDAYRRLYGKARWIETVFTLSTLEAFRYCQDRRYFVLITAYTSDGQFLVERTFTDTDISWSLWGGSLRLDRNEDFIAAANRIAHHSLECVDLADIEPIAFLRNAFRHESEECVHEGIAFAARLRNKDTRAALQEALRTRSQLVPTSTPRTSISLRHNADVFDAACAYVDSKVTLDAPFHEHEIAENLKYRARYKLHDLVLKPCLRFASKHTHHPFTIDDLNQRIESLIFERKPTSLIDVACGENNLCSDIAATGHIPLVVGNDVSWSQIELMQQRNSSDDSAGGTIFTNHDATALPFDNRAFSVSICKNALHHMPDRSAVESLIAEATNPPTTTIYHSYRGELTLKTGLIHLRNRTYDPTTGTFLTRDPVGEGDGSTVVANPYAYVRNDPLNRVDPMGLRSSDTDIGVGSTGSTMCSSTLVVFCHSLDLSHTSQASASAGNGILDWITHRFEVIGEFLRSPSTFGYCGAQGAVVAASIGGSFPFNAGEGTGCVLDDGDELGATATIATGWGLPLNTPSSWGPSVGALFSNADRISDLGGWAVCVGGSAMVAKIPKLNIGVGPALELCVSAATAVPSSLADLSETMALFVGVAGGPPAPSGELHVFATNTWIGSSLDYPQLWYQDESQPHCLRPNGPSLILPCLL